MSEYIADRDQSRRIYMGETDIQTINSQIAEGLRHEFEDAGSSFLNNLHSNFPGGFIRKLTSRLGIQDQLMVDASEVDMLVANRETFTFSDRAIRTTWRDFFPMWIMR